MPAICGHSGHCKHVAYFKVESLPNCTVPKTCDSQWDLNLGSGKTSILKSSSGDSTVADRQLGERGEAAWMARTVAKAHKNMFSTACDCIGEQKCGRELVHGYSTELDRDWGREECVGGRKLQPVVIIRTSQCEMQCFFLIFEYIYVCVWVGVCGTRERKICKIYSDAIQCQKWALPSEFTNGATHLLLEGARRLVDATLMESASTFKTKLELAS